MQQIADWLAQLGMSEYTRRFAENAIDLSVLPARTSAQNSRCYCGSFRRGEAKGKFDNGAEPKPLGVVDRAQPPPPIPAETKGLHLSSADAASAAERRYLTVMFCDLVGSTGIAAKLDAAIRLTNEELP